MGNQTQVIIKESAHNDLEEQYQYYAQNYSLAYAEKFRLAFFDQVKSIMPNPLKNPECRFLITKSGIYRNIVWGNHLIIYKIKIKVIEVLVLFHTKQHPRKLKAARRIK